MSWASSFHVTLRGLALFGLRQRRRPIRGYKGKKKICPGPKKPSSRLMILDVTAFKLLAYNQPILKPDLQALQRRAL